MINSQDKTGGKHMNLKTGDRVVVRGSQTIWDGVEGTVKYHLPDDKWPIGIDFDGGFNGFKYEEVEKINGKT
jgi:hypothetical protein